MTKHYNLTKQYILYFSIFIIYFILDYFNIPSQCIKFKNINIKYISIILNPMINFLIFNITFIFLYKKNIEKEDSILTSNKNKTEIAKTMLLKTYKNCLFFPTSFMVNKKHHIKIAKKCNFNKYINNDDIFQKLLIYPFQNIDYIYNFINTGYISKEDFEDFIEVQSLYQSCIILMITFYDDEQLYIDSYIELKNKIESSIKNIEKSK